MPAFYGAIDLVKNELRNAVVQNLGSAPAAPVKGIVYFNTTDNILYWYNGSQWIAAQGGAGAVPGDTASVIPIGGATNGGSSTLYSRTDHVHSITGWGVVTAQQSFGLGSANGSGTTFARNDHVHGTPNHGNAEHTSIPLNTFSQPTGPVNMNGQKIINVGDPTASTDAANKQYVDAGIAGLSWKDACNSATTTNITLSGTQTIDGVVVVVGERVLVKNQTNKAQNGIYVVASGAWTRATDVDSAGELEGHAVFVITGVVNPDTAWVCTTNGPITVGTTFIDYAQFIGAGSPPTGTAGGDLTGSYPNPTLAVDAVETAALQDQSVTDLKLFGMPQGFKGRWSAGTGNVQSLTGTQATVLLDVFTSALKGLAPPSGGGTVNFLRADGMWAPSGAAAGTVIKFAAALTGTGSPETVTHNLNTRDIQLTVYNGATPYTAVEVDWDAATVNTATVRYNPNLGAGYRVVVMG